MKRASLLAASAYSASGAAFQGTTQSVTLYEVGERKLSLEYFYETLEDDLGEYLNFKIMLENYDYSDWTRGDGFWIGISFGEETMAANPDAVMCYLESYDPDDDIDEHKFVCDDADLRGYGQPNSDTVDNLDPDLATGFWIPHATLPNDKVTLLANFRRLYNTGDAADYVFQSKTAVKLMWAFGEYDTKY